MTLQIVFTFCSSTIYMGFIASDLVKSPVSYSAVKLFLKQLLGHMNSNAMLGVNSRKSTIPCAPVLI